jgi:hypothetical protein
MNLDLDLQEAPEFDSSEAIQQFLKPAITFLEQNGGTVTVLHAGMRLGIATTLLELFQIVSR